MIMHKKRIYVDLDDVLCETAQRVMEIAQNLFSKTICFEHIHSFDLGVSFGLSAGEIRKLMRKIHDPEILLEIPPRPGAMTCLSEWVDLGYEIFVVTGRPPTTNRVTEQWLTDQKMPYQELLFVDKYGRFSSSEPPSGATTVALKELDKFGFSFAVEDSAEVAQYLSEQLNIPVMLLDRPWNRNDPFRTDIVVRCPNWIEAPMMVHSFLLG